MVCGKIYLQIAPNFWDLFALFVFGGVWKLFREFWNHVSNAEFTPKLCISVCAWFPKICFHIVIKIETNLYPILMVCKVLMKGKYLSDHVLTPFSFLKTLMLNFNICTFDVYVTIVELGFFNIFFIVLEFTIICKSNWFNCTQMYWSAIGYFSTFLFYCFIFFPLFHFMRFLKI